MKKLTATLTTLVIALAIVGAVALAPAPAAAAQECEPRFCWTQGYVVLGSVVGASRTPLEFFLIDEWGNTVARVDVPDGPMAQFLLAHATPTSPAVEVVTRAIKSGRGEYGPGWPLRNPLCIYPVEGPRGDTCGWHEEPSRPGDLRG